MKNGEKELRRALRRLKQQANHPISPGKTLIGTITQELKDVGGQVAAVRQYVLIRLEVRIEMTFNLEEIRSLCFQLGIDYENLEGKTKSAKINALIQHVDQNSRMDDLVEAVAYLRPGLSWA